jgi:hypothetical protein
MADHLNLAAACISVIAWPHWENQYLPLLAVAAGALPGKWFNPTRIGRKAQNPTSDFSQSFKTDSNSSIPTYVAVSLTAPESDVTTSPADISFTYESAHAVTSDKQKRTPISLKQDSTVYVLSSVESDSATKKANDSSSYFSFPVALSSNMFNRLWASFQTIDLPNIFHSTSSKNSTIIPNDTAFQDSTAVKSDTAVKNDTLSRANLPSSSTTPPNDNDSTIDKESMVSKSNPTNSFLYTSQTSSSLFSTPSNVSPVSINNNVSTPYLHRLLRYDSEPTNPIPRWFIGSLLLNLLLGASTYYLWRLSKQLKIAELVPVDPVPVELQRSGVHETLETIPLDPVPVDLQWSDIDTIETTPIPPSHTNAETQTTPVIPTIGILGFSSIQQVSVDPISVDLKHSAIEMIDIAPMPPSYTNAKSQTTPVIAPPLGFSGIGGVSVAPVPAALHQSNATSYTNTGVQTESAPKSFSKIWEVSSAPTEDNLAVHKCSGCDTIPFAHVCYGCLPAPVKQSNVGCQTDSIEVKHFGNQTDFVGVKHSGSQTDSHVFEHSGSQTDSFGHQDSGCQTDSVESEQKTPVEHNDSGCQTDFVEVKHSRNQTDSHEAEEKEPVEHKESGCQTEFVEVIQKDFGCQTDPVEVEQKDSVDQEDPVNQEDSDGQEDSVDQENPVDPIDQEDHIEQAEPGAEMEPVDPVDFTAPRVTQQLAYNPFPHANEASHPAHQERPIDTLDHAAWPYSPTQPAPKGWQNREDFAYPDLPKPQKLDVVGPRKEGPMYRNEVRNWERTQSVRAIDAQRDYEEYVSGPGHSSRSVDLVDLLFRPVKKQLTKEEEAELSRERNRRVQAAKRRAGWKRNRQNGTDQAGNGQSNAGVNSGGQQEPPERTFDWSNPNPRDFDAMGLTLPIRLPLPSEDMRQPMALGNDLFSPPSEVNAEVNMDVNAASAGPRTRMPPRAQDNRNPVPPGENALLNLLQDWNADAKGSAVGELGDA